MNKIETILQFIFLLASHPLESIDVVSYNLPIPLSIPVIGKGVYVTPYDGVVKRVTTNNKTYQIELLIDDRIEIIYSGLNKIIKSEGDIVNAGEIIGTDETINENTKYVMMLCNNATSFPQFENNKLIFYLDKGTVLHSLADAKITEQSFSLSDEGYYIKFSIIDKPITVTYEHLMEFSKPSLTFVHIGEYVGFSGNTGKSKEPQMSIDFNTGNETDNFRVIYLRIKKSK